MDRPIIYDQSQGRDYDVLHSWRSTLLGLAKVMSGLLGSTSGFVSGLAATPTGPTSLTINIAAGEVYQLGSLDATTYGSLTADTTSVLQQGFFAGGTVTLDTSALTSGKSRYALIQAQYSQVDDIPSDDPNGGVLPYLNTTNPSGAPWSGPANAGTTQNTRRKSVGTISVVYGTVANTGTETPPSASAGALGLYLIDLAFGQTTISSGQILTAGPSVGTNVPNNYPYAPFIAGLLNSHHSGNAGQAPKVNLASEVQGVLPSSKVDPYQSASYAADSGSVNAIVAVLSPVLTSYTDGMTFRVKIANPNTSTTVTVNAGGGALTVVDQLGRAPRIGDLQAGGIAEFTKLPGVSQAQVRIMREAIAQPTFRNLLINGDMSIAQRGASQTLVAAAAAAYTVDRWYASCTGANVTGAQIAGTGAYANTFRFTGATSNTGILFGQRILSTRAAQAKSKQVTGQIELASSSITSVTWTAYYANSADNFSAKTQIATGTITITSMPTVYGFGFNAGANAANGIALEFSAGALVSGQTFDISGGQLELGSIASGYEYLPSTIQLTQCQYYYLLLSAATSNVMRFGVGYENATGNSVGALVPYSTMRTLPSVSITGNFKVISSLGDQAITSPTVTQVSPSTVQINGTVASAMNGYACILSANSDTSASISFNAEI